MDRQHDDNWRRDAEALATELNNAIGNNNNDTIDKNAWQQRLLQVKRAADSVYEDLPSYERRKQAETLKKLEDLLQQYIHSSSSSADNTTKTSRFKFGRSKGSSAALQPVSCPPPLPRQVRAEDSAKEEKKEDKEKEQQSPGTIRSLEHFISLPCTSSSTTANFPSSISSYSNLEQCIIDLSVSEDAERHQDANIIIPALYLDNISDCLVIAPNIAGSVLIHDARNCVIMVSCHQFRMHRSHNMKILIDIEGTPILEQCKDIEFANLKKKAEMIQAADNSRAKLRIEDFDIPNSDADGNDNGKGKGKDGVDNVKSWSYMSDTTRTSILDIVENLPRRKLDAVEISNTLAALKIT